MGCIAGVKKGKAYPLNKCIGSQRQGAQRLQMAVKNGLTGLQEGEMEPGISSTAGIVLFTYNAKEPKFILAFVFDSIGFDFKEQSRL